jgi:coenzyme F420-reducing hydrogenase gamma subunit
MKMTKTINRAEAHIRYAGFFIDASFRKDGSVEYYVVEGGIGRFYSLEVAKEIAEARKGRKAA